MSRRESLKTRGNSASTLQMSMTGYLSRVVKFDAIGEEEKTLSWQVPTRAQIDMTTVVVSGGFTSITEPMMPYAMEMPEMKFLSNPSETFRLLKVREETIEKLDEIKPWLESALKNVWDQLEMEDVNSVKSAANDARIVIDEISWQTPCEHILQLLWCKKEEKKKPTRASRYAWILHGNTVCRQAKMDKFF